MRGSSFRNNREVPVSLLKSRIAATDQKLEEMRAARKVAQKASRQAYKQSKADRDRKGATGR
jgi:hypothetical protein